MSTTYEETTTTQQSSSPQGLGLDRYYATSVNGILKIVEIILTLIAFICASIPLWFALIGGGWVSFVTVTACIITAVLFVFHLFRIIYKLPGPWGLIELIYYIAVDVCLLIAGIVAAARAAQYANSQAIGACAFFTFAALVVYIVDTFFMFRGWRTHGSHVQNPNSTTMGTGAATVTSTTTHTSYETKDQY